MKTVCAYCKKTMDITPGHPEMVSHGICPDCLRKYFPEYADEILKTLSRESKHENR